MKKILLFVIILTISPELYAQTCTSIVNGSWNNASTWSCGVVPTTGYSQIVIAHKVTVPSGNASGNGSLTIQSGAELELVGQLNLGTDETNCNNTLTILNGGKVTATSNGNNERLRICGTVVLSGNPNGQGEYISPSGYAGPASFNRGGVSTLPVEILYFEGTVKNAVVNLKWATSYEDNFDFFTIERSHDAVNFEALGSADGSGNSTSIKNYHFADIQPLNGRAYYRLKATDFDGSVEYHKIITVIKEGAVQISVFPNPLSGNNFKIVTTLQPKADHKVKINRIVGSFNGKEIKVIFI